MPSFGFLVSITSLALAALSSAAPSGYGGDHHVADVDAIVGGIANNNNNNNNNVGGVQQSREFAEVEVGNYINAVNGNNFAHGNHGREIPDAEVVPTALAYVAALTSDHAGKGADVERRCNSGCRSLPDILVDVTAKLTPSCNKLTALADVDITVEVIAPICKEISGVVLSASAEIKLLIGQPLETTLLLSGKVIALADVAKLVADLLCLILGALAAVIKVVATVKLAVILPLLTAVGLLVADLCATIFLAVHGLAPLVVGLICKIVPALFHLRLYAFIGLLGL